MESLKVRVLRALRESEGFLSGQELCEQMGVSRTAVWKAIRQLKEEGYEIRAVQNKGYHLEAEPENSFGADAIRSRIHTEWAGLKVCFLSEVDSTNTYAKHLAEEGEPSGTLVVADSQTHGKGRRGRVWNSPPGSSIYMTLLLRPEIRPEHASMVTLVMGLSVAEGIAAALGAETGIKWPNDVVMNGKKVVGILTEMSAQIDYVEYLVIGVGINANNQAFAEEIADKATSLEQEIGHAVDRSQIVASIMEAFEKNYEIFAKTEDLTGLLDSYQKILVNYQQPVRVLQPGQEYEGIARGINRAGELLVERQDGTVEAVYAGEVSVRGLYGYV